MVVINLSSYYASSSPSSLRSPISLLPLKPHFLRLKPQHQTPFPYPSISSSSSSFHGLKSRESFKSWAFAGIDPGNFESAQSVLEACLVLTAIVVVHESGHFLAATLQGIHVSKFAVGFGPILAKFNAKNVEYSVRAFPLGGFVGFPDNDPDSEIPPDDKNLLKNRPILDRAIVISAGVIANVVFAYVIIFVQILAVGLPVQEAFPGVLIPEVRPFSAASRDGILAGDVVVAVDGAELPKSGSAAVSGLVGAIKSSPKRTLVFKIERAKKDFDVSVTPDENSSDGTGKIGVQLSPNTKFTKVRPKSISDAFSFSWREFSGLTWNVVDGLRQTFANFSQTAGKVSGPVAIIAVGAEVARSNSDGLYQFAALLNINLAVINLLPFPALDGGSLALIAVEAVRGGRKIPKEIEQTITSSGIMVVVLFGLYLIVKDTLNLDFVRDIL